MIGLPIASIRNPPEIAMRQCDKYFDVYITLSKSSPMVMEQLGASHDKSNLSVPTSACLNQSHIPDPESTEIVYVD